MPLITFTGLPSSGKTEWAKRLQNGLQERIDRAKEMKEIGCNYSVTYHSDDTLGISHSAYIDSNSEKRARGSQMSAVKRDISPTNIVILDSLAYIKGFRYQLYCEAKGLQTPHCVIHTLTSLEKCIEWNNNPERVNKWNDDIIRQLDMRYEEPNNNSRWDSPLYTIVPEDENEKLQIDDIWDTIVMKKAPPPNAATVIKATSGNDFLQELDKQTQEVISKILQHQQINIGGFVNIDKEHDLRIMMPPSLVSVSQLQRIRRTFVSLNRMRNIDIPRITAFFVEYVNRSLNMED
ncbi:uncharacterized protein PRCAT00005856001 [Priceomyces carsonii]|uniref:uncharacterized protein n=1 Tax=Priceomyces carsonii TaxID=28549 RepID=UPI002ED93214|nr:unnamed protein product [Priceomyces carsonii]